MNVRDLIEESKRRREAEHMRQESFARLHAKLPVFWSSAINDKELSDFICRVLGDERLTAALGPRIPGRSLRPPSERTRPHGCDRRRAAHRLNLDSENGDTQAGVDNARTIRRQAQAWSPTRRHRGTNR